MIDLDRYTPMKQSNFTFWKGFDRDRMEYFDCRYGTYIEFIYYYN